MLEADTQMELKEYRSFIDKEMIVIMGQMDSASKIFDHVYLVSKIDLRDSNHAYNEYFIFIKSNMNEKSLSKLFCIYIGNNKLSCYIKMHTFLSM